MSDDRLATTKAIRASTDRTVAYIEAATKRLTHQVVCGMAVIVGIVAATLCVIEAIT